MTTISTRPRRLQRFPLLGRMRFASALLLSVLLPSVALGGEEVHRDGVFLRAGAEYSRTVMRQEWEARFSHENTAAWFDGEGPFVGRSFGGRIEVGYAIQRRASFAVIPRGAFSVHHAKAETMNRTIEGVEFEWDSEVYHWAATVGTEFQFGSRVLGFSADVGITGAPGPVTEGNTRGLQVENYTAGGVLGRLGVSVRLPWMTRWGGGLNGYAEGMLGPWSGRRVENFWGTRVGVGMFVEWDGGRK